MARKNPVSERDREIGRRLRQFREQGRLSRVAFAQEVGIDAARLWSYEDGRVPLPYAIARSACSRFDISLQWLAEGIGVPSGYLQPDSLIEDDVRLQGHRTLSEAYHFNLRNHLKQLHQESQEYARAYEALLESGRSKQELTEHFRNVLEHYFHRLPPNLHRPYFGAVLGATTAFHNKHHREIETARQAKVETKLTTAVTSGIERGMPSWAELKANVQRFTKNRGAKAALARHCGVTPQAVAKWLDEGSETQPAADTAFKLLQWVEAAEAKHHKSGAGTSAVFVLNQKQSAGASTPAPKAQGKPESSHEIPKTKGRRKK